MALAMAITAIERKTSCVVIVMRAMSTLIYLSKAILFKTLTIMACQARRVQVFSLAAF